MQIALIHSGFRGIFQPGPRFLGCIPLMEVGSQSSLHPSSGSLPTALPDAGCAPEQAPWSARDSVVTLKKRGGTLHFSPLCLVNGPFDRDWIQILTPHLTSWVIMGKFLKAPFVSVSLCVNEDCNSIFNMANSRMKLTCVCRACRTKPGNT